MESWRLRREVDVIEHPDGDRSLRLGRSPRLDAETATAVALLPAEHPGRQDLSLVWRLDLDRALGPVWADLANSEPEWIAYELAARPELNVPADATPPPAPPRTVEPPMSLLLGQPPHAQQAPPRAPRGIEGAPHAVQHAGALGTEHHPEGLVAAV